MNGNGHRLWTLALVVITALLGALAALLQSEIHQINGRIDAVRDYVINHQLEK